MDAETERLLRQLRQLATQRERRRAEYDAATERLTAAVRTLVNDHGVSERRVAEAAGVARQSVRTWAGRDSGWPG
jgi:AcrR family transcriptional regulator